MSRPQARTLVTGATGQVGRATLEVLTAEGSAAIGAIRRPEGLTAEDRALAADWRAFDFARPEGWPAALQGVERLFLLRPPAIADTDGVFRPLVAEAVRAGVRHVTFLSVQGAGESRWVPHHGIERALRDSGMAWTFLRPAYFMQNFTSTLLPDLRERDEIAVPAGRARFALVDVRDVGRVAARTLLEAERFAGQAPDLTTDRHWTFGQMAETLSAVLERPIRYRSPSLPGFWWRERRRKPLTQIGVMILLHALPRWRPAPPLSDAIRRITGTDPIPFPRFARDHSMAWSAAKRSSSSSRET